ncbi:fimbrial protein [Utexia brackfieldae]|uniref:fimbrial protein n=1 Tax=Utexia brackfieldae TaxID=3074108 RepID=UPI00370DDC3C
MKLSNLALITLLSGSMLSTAMADTTTITGGSGTVNFTGSINSGACSISPESVDQTVDLGSVTKSVLESNGTSSPQSFQINLEDCDLTGLTNKTINITFSGAAAGTGSDATLLGIVGSGAGAGIQITDSNGTPVTLGQATTSTHVLQAGNNTLLFSAYLKKLSSAEEVTPGAFTSVTDFVLSYE